LEDVSHLGLYIIKWGAEEDDVKTGATEVRGLEKWIRRNARLICDDGRAGKVRSVDRREKKGVRRGVEISRKVRAIWEEWNWKKHSDFPK